MYSDLLHPIYGNNRKERLFVEYEVFMRNITEGLALSILEDNDDAKLNFKNIEIFFGLSPEQLYNATCLLTPEEFMHAICDLSIPDEVQWELLDNMLAFNNLNRQLKTAFEYALVHLAEENFVEKIVICKKRDFLPFEVNHLINIFGDSKYKVELFIGDTVHNVLDSNIGFTTICTSNLNALLTLMKLVPSKISDQTMFILNASAKTIDIDKYEKGKVEFTCNGLIEDIKLPKKNVMKMFPHYITERNIPY